MLNAVTWLLLKLLWTSRLSSPSACRRHTPTASHRENPRRLLLAHFSFRQIRLHLPIARHQNQYRLSMSGTLTGTTMRRTQGPLLAMASTTLPPRPDDCVGPTRPTTLIWIRIAPRICALSESRRATVSSRVTSREKISEWICEARKRDQNRDAVRAIGHHLHCVAATHQHLPKIISTCSLQDHLPPPSTAVVGKPDQLPST